MKGFLDEEKHWENGVLVPEVSPDAVPCEEIERFIHEGYKRFLIRPGYILPQLFRISKSSYRLNLLLNNLKRLDAIVEGVRLVT